MTLTLSTALQEVVTVNLVPSGTASYGTAGGDDWALQYKAVASGGTSATGNLNETPCTNAMENGMPVGCQVEIPAGSTIVDVDVVTNSSATGKNATLTVTLPNTYTSTVEVGSSPSVTLNIQ